MTRKIILFLFAGLLGVFFLLTACEKNTQNELKKSDALLEKNADIYNNYIAGTTSAVTNDQFNILKVERKDSKLSVTVSYSGGCNPHSFKLIWNGVITPSYPPVMFLVLYHSANGDNCEALITETLDFDLNTILKPDMVKLDYLFTVFNGSIPANNGGNKPGDTLNIFPSGIIDLVVKAQEVKCGQGIYKNIWFWFEKGFFLQPANYSTDFVKNFQVIPGKTYMLKLEKTNITAYDSSVTCLAYPGPSVPVKIHYIKEINDVPPPPNTDSIFISALSQSECIVNAGKENVMHYIYNNTVTIVHENTGTYSCVAKINYKLEYIDGIITLTEYDSNPQSALVNCIAPCYYRTKFILNNFVKGKTYLLRIQNNLGKLLYESKLTI